MNNEKISKLNIPRIIFRDLCIDNLITDEFYDSRKTIIKVKSISEHGINLDIKENVNYSECHQRYYKFDELYPIPISEDLLLKLGAFKLDFKHFPSFNLKGMQINYIDGLWIEYVNRIELKGLHHLQNVFYFSKSEDLLVSNLYNSLI